MAWCMVHNEIVFLNSKAGAYDSPKPSAEPLAKVAVNSDTGVGWPPEYFIYFRNIKLTKLLNFLQKKLSSKIKLPSWDPPISPPLRLQVRKVSPHFSRLTPNCLDVSWILDVGRRCQCLDPARPRVHLSSPCQNVHWLTRSLFNHAHFDVQW